MSRVEREAREKIGPPPSEDPVERAGHVLKVYMGADVADKPKSESEVLVTATRFLYQDAPWTGMTWGDLQKLWALAEQAEPALEALREIDRELDSLKVPRQTDLGAIMSPPQRLMWLMVEPFKPRREDAVARWLKRMRDHFGAQDRLNEVTPEARELKWRWGAIDGLLDRYRECADLGLSLEPEDDEMGMP
jgi:hypothetical protein